MAVALPPAVVDAAAAIEAMHALDPDALTPADQLGVLDELVVLTNRLDAVKVKFAGAVDVNDVSPPLTGMPTRSYLSQVGGLDPGEASKLVRLGRSLPFAPLAEKALAAGDINTEHALLIVKVLRHIKDDAVRETVEHELVKMSLTEPPFEVKKAVDQLLVALGADKSAQDAHERRFAKRGVGVDETFGGSGSLNGTLTPELREKLRVFFASFSSKAGPEDERTQRQRHHDALEELVDFGLAHMDNLSPVDGERPRLYVHIDYRHLAGLLESHEAVATLGSGVVVPAQVARRLACDAQLIPVVLGANSEVLDIGSTSRHPTAAITRATYVRDQGRCSFPGCRRRNLRQHHMKYWSKWHQTSYDVMAWVCAFHHWLVHEGGWTMRRKSGCLYIWTAPDGHEVETPESPPPRQPQAA